MNAGHTYSCSGDSRRRGSRVNVGLLGVDWEADLKNGRYRLARILRTPDWTRGIMPPLAKPGLNIADGDYLLKVNGTDVTTDKNIYSYFINLADKQLTLLVNSKPKLDGAREVTVRAAGSESLPLLRVFRSSC